MATSPSSYSRGNTSNLASWIRIATVPKQQVGHLALAAWVIDRAADKAADMFWSRWLISMLATLEALQTLWKSTFEMDPRYRLK